MPSSTVDILPSDHLINNSNSPAIVARYEGQTKVVNQAEGFCVQMRLNNWSTAQETSRTKQGPVIQPLLNGYEEG